MEISNNKKCNYYIKKIEDEENNNIIHSVFYVNKNITINKKMLKEMEKYNYVEFCDEYKTFKHRVPLVVVPTAYNTVTEKELVAHGVNMVIYANHLIRGAYKSMKEVAETILKNERSFEVNDKCTPVKELFALTNR